MSFKANDDFYHIEAAIKAGEIAYARECLRDVLQVDPSAEAWYLAAVVARSPEQHIQYLEKALSLDPDHSRARLSLEQAYLDEQSSTSPAAISLIHRIRDALRQQISP
jgi:tetratricopeptide (TPR) repeat protein